MIRHHRPFQLPLLAAVCVCVLAGSASAQFVTRFEVSPAAISPNGDTRNESATVTYVIASNALDVSLVVFAADSVTPIDTLRAPAPDTLPGPPRNFTWSGKRQDGSFAGEGAYVVTLRATPQSGPTVVSHLPVFVDVTKPTVQILSVTPDPYAPGLSTVRPALDVSVLVGSASPLSPGRAPDRLGAAVTDHTGKKVDNVVFTTDPDFTGTDGNYTMSWDATSLASSLPGGEYIVTVTVDDAAGFTAQAVHHFVIDANPPSISVTSPSNPHVQTIPDSLRGNANDVNGIDSLYVRYPNSGFVPIGNGYASNDTLRFAVFVADSVTAEGDYRFRFRAVDGAGRSRTITYTLSYDVTAPAAPVLNTFAGTWTAPVFPLEGTVQTGGDLAARLVFTRGGVPVDTMLASASGQFTAQIPLRPGANSLAAYQVDGAGNTSGPSNTVLVDFDTKEGVTFPVPFGPGDSFQVNLGQDAVSVTLRVFDVGGNLVTLLTDNAAGTFHTFVWSGRNSSDHAVKRGPLVAVAAVDYADGTHSVFRKVFLFDPDAP